MKDFYRDIMDMPHPVSPGRPHMPLSVRAAQFAPFAALSGYGEAVEEGSQADTGKSGADRGGEREAGLAAADTGAKEGARKDSCDLFCSGCA